MIDAVEGQIYEVSSRFPFIKSVETLLKTPNTIKISGEAIQSFVFEITTEK